MLDDKVIVVWGAKACALTAAIASLLNSRGARVQETAGALADPSDSGAWAARLSSVADAEGRIDGLVVVSASDPVPAPIASVALSDFRNRLRGSAIPAWLAIQQAVLAFRRQGVAGAIVNVTCASPATGYAGDSALAVASAGVLMAAKAAALECGKAGDGTVINSVVAEGNLERDASDVAEAVAYLLGDGAGYMTGTELVVGGVLR